jgi:hypothetical protein
LKFQIFNFEIKCLSYFKLKYLIIMKNIVIFEGKRLDTFSYDDLSLKRIKYVHDEYEFSKKNSIFSDAFKTIPKKDDWIDLRVSDGKNDATETLNIYILRNDNQIPLLISTYSLRCKELQRKQLSVNELKIVDKDTPNDQLKVVITHPPQFGTIEKLSFTTAASISAAASQNPKTEDKLISINTNNNQKVNFILKFNTENATSTTTTYMPVNEFTMADILSGQVFYNHRSPGVRQDRFGFVVYDGFNQVFIIEGGTQVSDYQVFNIYIDLDKNLPPQIDKNNGLDYLYQLETVGGFYGRLLSKNELLIVDKDDSDQDLLIELINKPQQGHLEHKDRQGVPLTRFTQFDINSNRIYYILSKNKVNDTFEDSFDFDVRDKTGNSIKNNRFTIKWSELNFEDSEISVMESEGKVRVHIRKTGNLKRFSMITCKTVSDSARSNRDSKSYDFIHTNVKVEFNEDESIKACDVIINKDAQIEPIESFYIVIEDPKYSIVGDRNRIKINILDKARETSVEFERTLFEVKESDRFISIPIVRSLGSDLTHDLYVDCLTKDETANADQDYVPRLLHLNNNNNNNVKVKIAAGESYGFCDVELIDDDLHEMYTETFKVFLANPSPHNTQLGGKFEAIVSILGPNDGKKINPQFTNKLLKFTMF